MAPGDREREMTDCERMQELLPWYVSGTLEAAERRTIADHLASCAGCRGELAKTTRIAWITDQHVPAETLAEYALGLPLEGLDRSVVERHLAHCDSCRDELELAERGVSDPDEAPPAQRAPTGWAVAALAASVVLGVALGFIWRGQTATPGPTTAALTPRAGVPLVELLPQTARRGETGAAAAEIDPAEGPFVMLLVSLERPRAADRWSARLVDAGGDQVFAVESMTPDPSGALTLLVPTAVLPAGPSTLIVSGAEGDPSTGARYRLLVSPGSPSQPESTNDAQ